MCDFLYKKNPLYLLLKKIKHQNEEKNRENKKKYFKIVEIIGLKKLWKSVIF